jgi:predicted dehydrogenase
MKNLSRRSFIRLGVGTTGVVASLPMIQSFAAASGDLFQNKKLNIAICGLGRYGNYVADGILAASQYCRVAGIVTGTPSKVEDWKKRFNIPPSNVYNYQNFDEISKNKDIDLVYVILPNSMHKEFTIRAAKAGKHVIVEKPMAITEKDCEEMIKACDTAGVQLAMGYRLHYEPYNMELKRLGQEKVFGQVRLVEASLGYRSGTPGEWRLHRPLSGGGPLMNLGVYCIQASRYIIGEEPTSVSAQFGPITRKELFKEVEESITWQLQFPSGATATSTSSYSVGVDRVFAGADDGFFELGPAISYGPFRGRTSKGDLSFPEINQQAVQCDEIAKVILANKKLPDHISGKEGLLDVRVIEAIYKSAVWGQRISIK